jgi:hypothetical protein
MKTLLSSTAFAVVALAIGTPLTHASDLSEMFRMLETTQHTSALAAAPTAQGSAPAVPRMLLGAWLSDFEGRLQVSGTVPGSPASQMLQPGDVLCRISIAGSRSHTLRTLHQFEYAKRQIGPQRQCLLDVYRPGVGMIPMNITFETGGELASVALANPVPADAPPAAQGNGLAAR